MAPFEHTSSGSARLKKIVGGDVTAYFGPVEVRHFGQGAGEEVLSYPHASVRLVGGAASYLHGDQLGSVRTVTDAAGGLAKRSTYRPFGEGGLTLPRWLRPRGLWGRGMTPTQACSI